MNAEGIGVRRNCNYAVEVKLSHEYTGCCSAFVFSSDMVSTNVCSKWILCADSTLVIIAVVKPHTVTRPPMHYTVPWLQLFKSVSERGYWTRLFLEAEKLYEAGDVDNALILYLIAAELGVEVAESNVAFILEQGLAKFRILQQIQNCASQKLKAPQRTQQCCVLIPMRINWVSLETAVGVLYCMVWSNHN